MVFSHPNQARSGQSWTGFLFHAGPDQHEYDLPLAKPNQIFYRAGTGIFYFFMARSVQPKPLLNHPWRIRTGPDQIFYLTEYEWNRFFTIFYLTTSKIGRFFTWFFTIFYL